MTRETELLNVLLEEMMMQADDEGRQKIRDTFKRAIEGYATDLLGQEEGKQPQDELAALQSMIVEALAGLGLIAARRVEWDKVGNPQEIEAGILN
jgi:DNA-binding protein Fis